jgi:hypothetical protein
METHSQFRARAMKTLLSNAAQREERSITRQQSNRTGVRSVTPFWPKKHGKSPRQVENYYERRVDNVRPGNATDRSLARGKKRGRDGEEGSDNEEVTLVVLKLLDGKLNTFLTKSREQVKNRLMDSFWVFLLSEQVNPQVVVE